MLCPFIMFNIYIFILCSINVKKHVKIISIIKQKKLWRWKQLILFFRDKNQNLIYKGENLFNPFFFIS